jgi:hypothetical protein
LRAGFSNGGLEVIEYFMENPGEIQERHFRSIVRKGTSTKWGKQYGYTENMTLDQFRENVPISTYEQLFPYIDRAFRGEKDVLWPGRINWFSKSSGTTNDKSKYIPVTEESMDKCHFRVGQDALAIYFANKPDSKLFTGKSLSIGGSLAENPHHDEIKYGDVSAVLTENLPKFFEMVRTPSREVALMENWEEKVVAMANEAVQADITSLVGVPTWAIVLIRHIFETRGITSGNLLEIWPNLELFMHGGVNFDPYREQFKKMIPRSDMSYIDCYNASEGFFAVQNEPDKSDLLLMLDYGIFYEFIPLENLGEDHPRTHTIDEVEIGRNYAVVITTNGGLWRYMIGDTVMFTSKRPHKIKITGRTKQFINAFGEELMVDNAEKAITEACNATGALIKNFTVAPLYFEGTERGGHEWLLEFERQPDSIEHFSEIIDRCLRDLNSDYDAKRKGNLALGPPILRVLPPDTFHQWMKKRNKLGGQNKVPRLANSRKYVDDILAMVSVGEG